MRKTTTAPNIIRFSRSDLVEINPPKLERNDFLFLDRNEEEIWVPGLKRYEPFELIVGSTLHRETLARAFADGKKVTIEIRLHENTAWCFDAFVESFSWEEPIDGVTHCKYRLRISGPVKLEDNVRVVKRTRLPKKIVNKFYVAHPKVTAENEQLMPRSASHHQPACWTVQSEDEAVRHAEMILEQNPSKDHCAIVRIVRIVRRPKPKFISEKV